jgi:hypothetical protein
VAVVAIPGLAALEEVLVAVSPLGVPGAAEAASPMDARAAIPGEAAASGAALVAAAANLAGEAHCCPCQRP